MLLKISDELEEVGPMVETQGLKDLLFRQGRTAFLESTTTPNERGWIDFGSDKGFSGMHKKV